MSEPTITPAQKHALDELLGVMDGLLTHDLGPHLTCTECEAFAEFLEAFGHEDAATSLREGHALDDDEGDLPEHVALKAKLEGES